MIYFILGLFSGFLYWLITLKDERRTLIYERLTSILDNNKLIDDNSTDTLITRRQINISGVIRTAASFDSRFVSAFAINPDSVEDLAYYPDAVSLKELPKQLRDTLALMQDSGCVRGIEATQLISNKAKIPNGHALFVALTKLPSDENEVYAFIAPKPSCLQ